MLFPRNLQKSFEHSTLNKKSRISDTELSMKRYAIVGLGGRSSFFYSALAKDFLATSVIVGFCDTNQTRMNVANDNLKALSYPPAPILTYKAQDFEKMIKETKPDEVIITTMDRTHDIYIIKTLELGCNVITEKPMTIDEVRCKAVIDAVERTGKKVRVTFNYRYAPHNTKVFELLGVSESLGHPVLYLHELIWFRRGSYWTSKLYPLRMGAQHKPRR